MRTPVAARRIIHLGVFFVLVGAAPGSKEAGAGGLISFRRGDINMDGRITLSDASYLMNALHFAGPKPRCQDAADVDDDGVIGPKDPVYLLSWLFPETASPPAPPLPFQNPGKDPTADGLDCDDDTITPPGDPDPSLAFTLDAPSTVAQGQEGVEIFLRVTTSGALDGFSAAYLVDRASIEVVGMDLRGTDFPQDPEKRRLDFEASAFFRSALVPGPDSHHDLLLAGALFVEMVGGKYEKIAFPALLEAGGGLRLLRIVANVRGDAPLGDRDILTVAGPPPVAGAIHELIERGTRRLPVPAPGSTSIVRDAGEIFMRRADANSDGVVDISDPIRTLNHLFAGAPAPPCLDASDANDDASVNIADSIFTLTYLFNDGPPPGLPFPGCSGDPTPDVLSCAAGCG